MALAAGKTNNEVYTFRAMLKEDYAAQFIDAMKTEIRAHD